MANDLKLTLGEAFKIFGATFDTPASEITRRYHRMMQKYTRFIQQWRPGMNQSDLNTAQRMIEVCQVAYDIIQQNWKQYPNEKNDNPPTPKQQALINLQNAVVAYDDARENHAVAKKQQEIAFEKYQTAKRRLDAIQYISPEYYKCLDAVNKLHSEYVQANNHLRLCFQIKQKAEAEWKRCKAEYEKFRDSTYVHKRGIYDIKTEQNKSEYIKITTAFRTYQRCA